MLEILTLRLNNPHKPLIALLDQGKAFLDHSNKLIVLRSSLLLDIEVQLCHSLLYFQLHLTPL